ncbi:hypothetical protein D3C85_1335240 [compost metagenome]
MASNAHLECGQVEAEHAVPGIAAVAFAVARTAVAAGVELVDGGAGVAQRGGEVDVVLRSLALDAGQFGQHGGDTLGAGEWQVGGAGFGQAEDSFPIVQGVAGFRVQGHQHGCGAADGGLDLLGFGVDHGADIAAVRVVGNGRQQVAQQLGDGHGIASRTNVPRRTQVTLPAGPATSACGVSSLRSSTPARLDSTASACER